MTESLSGLSGDFAHHTNVLVAMACGLLAAAIFVVGAKSWFLETASDNLRHHLQTLSLLNGTLRKAVTDAEAQIMFAMKRDALDHLRDLLDSLLETSFSLLGLAGNPSGVLATGHTK